jgi:aminoglycoside N3'-acetyltransferase
MTSILMDLAKILPKYGVSSGDSLIFEFNSCCDADFERLANDLQQVVGENGLFAVPTCTHHEGSPKPSFNPKDSPSEMGPFSETFRHLPGVFRSNHPTHSLAAWGNDAYEVTSGHRYAWGRQTPWGDSAFGKNSPWDRLFERDSWWVLVNPDWKNSPLVAYASTLYHEQISGVTKVTAFPIFNLDWLDAHFTQLVEVHEAKLDGNRVLIFRMRQAVLNLLAAAQNPLDCFTSSEFKQWYADKCWLDEHGHLLAGAAKTCITPKIPFPRWEGKPIQDIFCDLYARAISLRSDSQHVVLVLCDLIGITRDLVLEVRRRVAAASPDDVPEVMVACTHAHSTPDTIGAGFAQPEYLEMLLERLVQVIGEATAAEQPARMGWSKTAARGIGGNRRWKMKDGHVFTTRYGVPSTWRVDPQNILEAGPIDPELTLVRIERLDGTLLAALTNFGVHPNIAMASSFASGDLTGEAMRLLEQVYGDSCIVFCTTGAAGDVDPTLEMPVWGPRTDPNVVRLGRLFAAQALEQLERTPVTDHHEIQTAQRELTLDVRPDWVELFAEGSSKLRSEYAEGFKVSNYVADILVQGSFTTEVQAIRLNDLILMGMPGEVFVNTGLELKKRGTLAIVETTNDYIGYIPPVQAFAEGGYECSQQFSSRVLPSAEETLRKSAESAIEALQDRNKTN